MAGRRGNDVVTGNVLLRKGHSQRAFMRNGLFFFNEHDYFSTDHFPLDNPSEVPWRLEEKRKYIARASRVVETVKSLFRTSNNRTNIYIYINVQKVKAFNGDLVRTIKGGGKRNEKHVVPSYTSNDNKKYIYITIRARFIIR